MGGEIMAIVGIDNPSVATAADIAALPADALAGATAADLMHCHHVVDG